jgi:SPP1 gp7 family putative phage head morphogenesis protein
MYRHGVAVAEPEVVRLAREHKAALLRGEQAQMREMARRWLAVERRLEAQMQALAYEMDAIKRSGGTVSRELLYTQVRYRELLIQLQDELRQYSQFAEVQITEQQRRLGRLGIANAQNSIEVQGVTGGFNRLPMEAVDYLAGYAGNGQPLGQLLTASWPLSAEGMTQELINGVALGYNPRKTAKNMAQGATDSVDRMMVIARTEQLRNYRIANLESYRASGVVNGYTRISARDDRVCAGCLAADGEQYDLMTDFQSHPQCRCTLIPNVIGVPLKFQTGAQWFDEQLATTQRDILGPGRYELWAKGDVTNFKEFMTVRQNAVWGDAVVPTPLGELVQ